jgi:hypothetical protein
MYNPEVFKTKSINQLIKIVYIDKSEYSQDAIKVAKSELASRNISIDEQERIVSFLKSKKERLTSKSDRNLKTYFKVLCVIFPVFPFSFVISSQLRVKGYNKMAREVVKYSLIGLFFYIFLATLMW